MGSWTVLLDLNLIVAISFRLETNIFSVCFRGLKLQFRSFAGKMILQRFDFTNKKKPKIVCSIGTVKEFFCCKREKPIAEVLF
jgi:hypothetical protein